MVWLYLLIMCPTKQRFCFNVSKSCLPSVQIKKQTNPKSLDSKARNYRQCRNGNSTTFFCVCLEQRVVCLYFKRNSCQCSMCSFYTSCPTRQTKQSSKTHANKQAEKKQDLLSGTLTWLSNHKPYMFTILRYMLLCSWCKAPNYKSHHVATANYPKRSQLTVTKHLRKPLILLSPPDRFSSQPS